MRVTIKDVARQARVSPATVSLVLNNAPGVSMPTREKVMRVMDEINYKPDSLARSFSSRRAEAIGLVMPPTLASLNDPYYMSLLRGVLESVRNCGYKMLIEIADERFMAQRLWEDLLERKRVDGLVIATAQMDQRYLAEIAQSGHMALLVNGARPDIPALDFVGYDDFRCGFDATYYLIGLGHRRIAHLMGPANQASAISRCSGYRKALERARIPFREDDILSGDYVAESAEMAIQKLIARSQSDRPSALFCANDTMAIAAMTVLQAHGWRIPEDLSIIGVDDTGAAALANPPLTTMRQDIYGLSSRAAAHFIKKLEDRTREVITETIPMTLVERGTCTPLDGRR